MIELPLIEDGEDKASPFKNRIRKNYRHVRKWAKRTSTDCFRIYDRDIKEYPVAIDFYAGRFLIQFFFSDREPDLEFNREVEEVIFSLFSAPADAIYHRFRIRRKKIEQYEKLNDEKEFFIVHEYGVKFKVNLVDYLDTGLFLDHRETRQMVARGAKGKRLLNLFAYTCSFSVHAALAGADFTKSVDMSNTYTQWGRENFALNGIEPKNHPIVREDCFKFLEDEVRSGQTYDLIVIDPPTISRSKKMEEMFDIQVDYIELIEQSLKLLAPGGTIYFSTNSRKFKMDTSLFEGNIVKEITEKTIPLDFHQQKIHRCWIIS